MVNEIIIIENVAYKVISTLVFLESREDFLKHAADSIEMLKDKFDKLVVLGTVKGKVIQQILCLNEVGNISLNLKSNETGRTDLGGEPNAL